MSRPHLHMEFFACNTFLSTEKFVHGDPKQSLVIPHREFFIALFVIMRTEMHWPDRVFVTRHLNGNEGSVSRRQHMNGLAFIRLLTRLITRLERHKSA